MKTSRIVLTIGTALVAVAIGFGNATQGLTSQVRAGVSWGSLENAKADWLRDDKIPILMQMGLRRHPESPGVPNILDVVKSKLDKTAIKLLLGPSEMGRTIVGDTELEWGPRDGFCIPNWCWHHHINEAKGDEAVLFAVPDIPMLRALGLYREEPEISLGAVEPAPVPADLARQDQE